MNHWSRRVFQLFIMATVACCLSVSVRSVAATPPVEADSPARWDASFFLPSNMPALVCSKYKGTSLIADKVPGVQVTLTDVATTFAYGSAKLSATLTVTENSRSTDLRASGSLVFLRVDADSQALFGVKFETLDPSGTIQAVQAEAAKMAARLKESGLLPLLSDLLSHSVPVPQYKGFAGFDDLTSFKTGDDGEVKVKIKAPFGGAFANKLTSFQAVFVPAGMWICANLNGTVAPLGANLPPEVRWQAFQESATKETARFYLRAAPLVENLNKIGTVTGTADGVSHKNKLVDGKASVWLSNDREHASVTATLAAEWTSAGALSVKCPFNATATAAIGCNFKLPIGSVGVKSVGCEGKGSGNPEGHLYPSLDTAPAIPSGFRPSATVIVAELPLRGNQPQHMHVHLQTDGTFKTKLPFSKYLKTDVPKIEIDATLPVPPDLLPHFTLLTNQPHPVAPKKAPNGWTFVPPAAGFPTHVMLLPEKPGWDDYGYVAGFNLSLVRLSPDEAKARTEAVRKMLGEVHRPKLTPGNIKVTVAGIGPNNDLIKALMVIGDAIVDAYNEAKKAGENVAETVAKATQDIEDEINRIPKNLERAPRNIEREVGKGFAQVTGIRGVRMPTAIKQANKAVAQGARNTANTMEKAANDTANAAKKGVNDVKKETERVIRRIVPRIKF